MRRLFRDYSNRIIVISIALAGGLALELFAKDMSSLAIWTLIWGSLLVAWGLGLLYKNN